MAAQIPNPTVKYEDIISKSVLIRSGRPDVYQLKPKKEKFGTVTRMTVGEKKAEKNKMINKTILLVGESGAGKSTLVNTLVNYSMGVKWEDKIFFKLIEEEEERSQFKSQTSDVIVYEIFGFEDKTLPYSLTIVDTPGYGSTEGIERDDLISHRLFDLFQSEDGILELHAVGLVMKSSDNRLNDRLMYVFDSMMSLFGNDLERNIIALITHSSGRKAKNAVKFLEAAKIKCAKHENQPIHFLFDNCQDEDRTQDEEHLQKADEISTRGMRDFTDFLEKSEPQKLEKTSSVLKERARLTACIQNLRERIKETELKQMEIKQIQEALKKHEEEMKKNDEFSVEVDEVYKDKEPVKCEMWGLAFYEGATCCKVCEETCHYPRCTMAWYPAHCEVMKGGRCTVCTNKCPASDHVKEEWRYVTKTRKVQKTFEKIKEKYQKQQTQKESEWILLKKNLEKEMKQLTAEKSEFLDESYQHVEKLEQIALKSDSVSTYVHLDFLIEKMKERGDTEKVQKLEEMRSRVNERTKSALQYKQRGKQP